MYTIDNMDELINRRTIASQVFDRVVDAIVRGVLPAGEPLSESDIATRFGVSRAPAREAVLRLESKGLVTRTPHVGARVVSLTRDDLTQLFEMREALEGMACRLAAERISERELADLSASLDAHSVQPELASGAAYFQEGGDQDFHFRIAGASRNMRIQRALCEDLYHLLRIYRFRSSARRGRAQEAYGEHRSILAALEARDPDGAEAAMRRHIRQSALNIDFILPGA
jgi:DNA-binding GntR family transcriptional regulator